MATDLPSDLEARLADLLERVTGWLQFAESKNTGIVGLISTVLGLIVSFSLFGPPLPSLARVGLAVGALLLMISLAIVVISFLPVTDLERSLAGNHDPPGPGDNLLYYGHLARYEPQALVQAVASMYVEVTPDEVAAGKRASDLAAQIVTNARIIVRKLALYRAALLLYGAGVLFAAAAIALAAFLE